MSKRCHHCRQEMSYGAADVEETVQGIRVRMLAIQAWTCPNCGQRQVTSTVAQYLSEYLRRLVTNLPAQPGDLERPLVATEVVFAAK